MNHAIELLSKHPGVRFGPFEIRPADEQINALVGEWHQRLEEKSNRPGRSRGSSHPWPGVMLIVYNAYLQRAAT